MNIPDNYDLYTSHERDSQKWLDKRPLCSECGEPIQEGECFKLGYKLICKHCVEVVDTEDFID